MYTQDEQNSGEQLALAIGQALAYERENSGLSVQDVAERTRISAAHLSALEAGQFERLPGVGYIPGFIRNYCQRSGLMPPPMLTVSNPCRLRSPKNLNTAFRYRL